MAAELTHLLQAAAIVDLTPGLGHYAMCAVRAQIPYLGCCYTQTHVDMLYEKLGVDVFANYAPPKQRGQKLYDNVMRPLIKRFFAKHVVEVGKKGRKGGK